MEKENNLLEEFTWEDNSGIFDVVDKETTEEVTEETTEEVEEETEEVEEDSTEETVEETIEEADDSEEPLEIEGLYSNLAEQMTEDGVFTIDLGEDTIEDAESFMSKINEEVTSRVQNELQDFIQKDLKEDPDAAAFIKFKLQGGSTKDFFALLQDNATAPIDLDMSDEDNQVKVLKHYLMNAEGKDEDEAESYIDYLASNGKRKSTAEKYANKIKADNDKKLEAINQRKQEEAVTRQKERAEYIKGIQKVADETEEVSGIKFNKKDKKELVDFINKPLNYDGQTMTGMAHAMNQVINDPKKLLLMAKLLKSDFDFSDIQKQVETKVTKKTKNKLANIKVNKKPSSSKSGNLWDSF